MEKAFICYNDSVDRAKMEMKGHVSVLTKSNAFFIFRFIAMEDLEKLSGNLLGY